MSYILDLSGQKCPYPVLNTKKYLAGLPSGAQITVIATDIDAATDLANFCNKCGHTLNAQHIQDGIITSVITKSLNRVNY